MAKYQLKTRKNDGDVDKFIDSVEDEQKRQDSYEIMKLMSELTGQPPVLWGKSIVGFGSYHYKGRSSEGDWMAIGFSPRKQNLTLYIMPGFKEFDDLMNNLGKYTTSVGCLYIKRLEDVDRSVLKELIKRSYEYVKAKLDKP
ncbi:MAG TPA: DUF1801 domain-containing protein [Candidatus Saccharimonadales bacterium]